MIPVVGDHITRRVFIDGVELLPKESQKVVNHSPDGFAWGYGGSGPSQLALALLMSVTDVEIAKRLYQELKWEMVSKWNENQDFVIDKGAIELWVSNHV